MKEEGDNEEESTIYESNGRSDLVEDDEINAGEEGFMKGYEEANEDDAKEEEDEEDQLEEE